MLQKLFASLKSRPREEPTADRLYRLTVAQARKPGFYTAAGVPDRIDARFELYTLHVLILVTRLRDIGEDGIELAQAVFDAYVSSLDNVLRELGEGDVAVSKKMRKLGEAVYGRMSAYETPLRQGDAGALAEAMDRNIHPGVGAVLADYAVAARARLGEQTLAQIIAGPDWPEAPQ
ncbi:ubiquinol-cytochrome C chaperone [Brevundimonas sp. Leaf363]|uniref:ubiquinol-cytochrome C chaperone family protein n=1 Tax=Brevundimonas sp. Leaf363 TaxID=1736353 RepID=UPI0006F9A686|nr:ubiquinol-cytochrome C chaperone family protein [Brevundimonas sp. Leaf363]KQS56226.1 ubiquinol-cytochrome C chaperone [Brevundimonas sp. Leaf363]